jgi:hypothetical protein
MWSCCMRVIVVFVIVRGVFSYKIVVFYVVYVIGARVGEILEVLFIVGCRRRNLDHSQRVD